MKITTHALDVYSGKPAKGLKVDAYFISDKRNLIKSITLNDDGRSDAPPPPQNFSRSVRRQGAL